MANIKPFKALRFNTKIAGNIKDLVSPPYDIINDKQYKNYIDSSEFNIVRLGLPKGIDPYNNAKHLLNEWIKNGILKKDEQDSIYIYEEEFNLSGQNKKIRGFICLVKLEEFSKKIILPHEETLSKAKEDRLNLLKATSCNFSQIYSLYIDEQNKTTSIINTACSRKPDIETTDSEHLTHRIWQITDKNIIDNLSKQFANKKLYIADGHHRYETAINYRNYLKENNIIKNESPANYTMMMLVNIADEGLVVFPTHRLIKNINNFNSDEVIYKCRPYFEIEQKNNIHTINEELNILYNENKKAFAFYCGEKKWTLFKLKNNINIKELVPNCSESLLNLDVTILHNLILDKAFGINKENMKNQSNLSYTRSTNEAIESVDNKAFQCAFILNPTRVTEIIDVALAGEKMPQKSTYFYPKLITGLIMNQIDLN